MFTDARKAALFCRGTPGIGLAGARYGARMHLAVGFQDSPADSFEG